MIGRCTNVPVSWLVLERYELGELAERLRSDVTTHLGSCEACRSCLDHLRRRPAVDLRELPPIPAPPSWRGRMAITGGLVAAAAVAILLLFVARRPSGPDHAALPGARVQIKGGEVAIALIRKDRSGAVLDATSFSPGDRFKIVLTCPPVPRWVDVAVWQAGQVFRPLPPARIACGNSIALPGAIELDGPGEVRICVDIADRDLENRPFRPVVCSNQLLPAPDGP
jgi:hypothetical protein